MRHPLLGFGTYKVGVIPAGAASGGVVSRGAKEVVLDALAAGYRCFDCAFFYGNDAPVGEAFEESKIPREELFIVSKVWTAAIYEGEEAVREQVLSICKTLRTTYLDLCLIHWPVPDGKHVAAYRALEKLHEEKVLRSIGLSNYTVEDYEELKKSMTVKPVVNQIEISPWLYRKHTIDYFLAEGVRLQSYRTLRQGKALEDPLIKSIAERMHRTPAQIVGRWCVQHGFAFFPKTQTRSRMEENANLFDFELSADDMAQLDTLTAPDAYATFRTLYNTGIVRDTPLQGKFDCAARSVTEN
jgi:diketogulonate reductase-like aldo/keto reductase